MTGWPMQTSRKIPAGAAVLVAALVATAAPGRADPLLSNSNLLSHALRAAADSTLRQLPVAPTVHVVVLPAAGQRPVWGLENELGDMLKRRLDRVSFHGPLADTATTPHDSVEAPAAAARRLTIDKSPLDPNADLLEYRVATLGVTYTDVHKSRVLGASTVDRTAQVSLGLRLLGPDGRMLWSGQASGTASDQVPASRLHEVEDNLFDFQRPQLPTRDLSRILEPAIVVGLVTGLVFLFYTNRN